MTDTATKPRVNLDLDPVRVLHRTRQFRQILRDGDEDQRLQACLAVVELELARLRGEWSPDGPSDFNTHEPAPLGKT